MAKITNTHTKEQVTLLSQHIFGRHPNSSNTVLINPNTSRMHATILWDGEVWLLQDSSSNGTFVNGKPVLKDAKYQLNTGDKINFASLSGDTWHIDDIAEPNSLLIPVTPGLPIVELQELAVLPSEDAPENTLYITASGDWVCESDAGTSVLKSGDLVGNSENTWRFLEAASSVKTLQVEVESQDMPEHIKVQFDVSQNEEHVSVQLMSGRQEYDLGERNHHYLLLLLARKRLQDQAEGLLTAEQGWVDKQVLSKMLGQNENHINIQIYRLRKQLLNNLPKSLSLPQIIERRTREIRFSYTDIEILGGAQMIKHSA